MAKIAITKSFFSGTIDVAQASSGGNTSQGTVLFPVDSSGTEMLKSCLDRLKLDGFSFTKSRTHIILLAQTAFDNLDSGELINPSIDFVRQTLGYTDLEYTTVSHACASGIVAMDLAAAFLHSGHVDSVVIVGATVPNRADRMGFEAVRALTSGICRPMDINASGTRMGSFAGVLLIERIDSSNVARGVQAIINGTGVATLGGGTGSVVEAQTRVVIQATNGIRPTVVVAHATGTVQGDRAEILALGLASETWNFGTTYVTSPKGAIGHAVHSAGLVSIASALHIFNSGIIPGTSNCLDPIESHDTIKILSEKTNVDDCEIDHILVNGFGFGGNNAAVFLSRSSTLLSASCPA